MKTNIETAKIKQRLEELRAEIKAEHISTGEIIELQSLAQYIDKGDVELLEWAGVPEFTDNETADLFDTPELIPDAIRAVFDKYPYWDDLTYENLSTMQKECEMQGYTFDYYLNATPFNLRKVNN